MTLLASILMAALVQGGMGDGPGGAGGRGPSKGPEQPPGSGEGGGETKKDEPKSNKPQIESMEIHLKFLPADLKACDAIEKALQKLPQLKKIAVTPGDAKMTFSGNWDQLILVQNVAAAVKLKGALVTPGIWTIDVAATRSNPTLPAAQAFMKVEGVNKAFGDGTRITVYGSMALLKPGNFDASLKEYGWRLVAIRSHRLRTLSYEPWGKGIKPESIRERLMKVPGVLRVDVDPVASTVQALLIRDTAKDIDLVAAAEDVRVTIFPGTAEEEEEPVEEPAPPAPPPAK